MQTVPMQEPSPSQTLDILRSRILVDGLQLVVDQPASQGSRLHDALSGREFLDFYSFFASQALSHNHPRMHEPAFRERLLAAAIYKPANPDVYSPLYAAFVKTLDEVAGLPGFRHFFFIDGGALAVENALKTAFDWKVRKNIAAGRGEDLGTQVIHFREAFHGRSGYTLSLTNTFHKKKVQYFPKFDWPRIDNPKIDFALPEPQRTADVAAREKAALAEIEAAVARHGHDIACLVLEPIQAEGGDNHFRPEFFRALRALADRHEFLLIFDEVQTGVGLTGRMWCCEHFGVLPDIIAFGKKMQVCGIMASDRIDDVDNVFKVSSRINSTWGANLTDMVRATQILRVIQEESLVDEAAAAGGHLLAGLTRVAGKHAGLVSAPRGRGLMCAIDVRDTATRDRVKQLCFEKQLLVLACGERAIRFRPFLDVETGDLDRGLAIFDQALSQV
jgi:L-lysine 6-transaminase